MNKGSSFFLTIEDEKEILIESNDSKIPNMVRKKIEYPVLSQEQYESTYSVNKLHKNNISKEEEEDCVANPLNGYNINNDDDEDEIDRKICLTSKELLSSEREDNNIEKGFGKQLISC